MRGGLDDALDKLARRDELRRRAAGEANGTPPAVTELVEAIAAVVARNPQLGVTVGVEGAGDPVLLQFSFADGTVQVNADNRVAARATDPAPRHADFEIDVEEPAEEPAPVPRASRDDQDRFGPTDFEYPEPVYQEPAAYAEHVAYDEPTTAEQPFVSNRHEHAFGHDPAGYADLGNTTPHPFAPTPPPQVPSQATPHSYAPAPAAHAYPEPSHPEPQPGFPEPLPEPIPLQVERPEETELAARRLAAMLRDNPSLLD
ncbi:hypothetical protein FHR83_005988 [Actinoplanes campanulatus]|uniref:Uncharacterized protein n=1 Tax=Actinoplanes campanulatus TaxID=113559 RepID=A0A7W5AL62_9ACTN|nr:hypothetical protein [Actinoplanes campanulatus]MBB3098293.1 hypothetical protein [Actinoplanes campanulatus]GGN34522.1 hypothetical protein GCM10010109_57630 [Actinoplanes campanulatus]GID38749.1 hypothetical protein Aca09nite_52550 [Actinoplanes campanulatus]